MRLKLIVDVIKIRMAIFLTISHMKVRMYKIGFHFFIFCFFQYACFGSSETLSSHSLSIPSYEGDLETLSTYFENFERLAKAEQWKEILSQGQVAIEAAKNTGKKGDEAKICAQLTSTAYYLGDYDAALGYATRCHQLAEAFEDPALFVRALYLESAVHRALAGKKNEQEQQRAYQLAVSIAEKARELYLEKKLDNQSLQGKIYFNWGAAHADNPQGDLKKAADCYEMALTCFKNASANDDIIRTRIRLGKVYLLQKKYDLSQETIKEARSQVMSTRISMQTDYLEAQLKLALHDFSDALRIAREGLMHAKYLEAKEDESRFMALIEKVNQEANSPK